MQEAFEVEIPSARRGVLRASEGYFHSCANITFSSVLVMIRVSMSIELFKYHVRKYM